MWIPERQRAEATDQRFGGRCGSVSPDGRMIGGGQHRLRCAGNTAAFCHMALPWVRPSAPTENSCQCRFRGFGIQHHTEQPEPDVAHAGQRHSPPFLHDGKYLAGFVDFNDGMVQVWRVPSGSATGTIVNKVHVDGGRQATPHFRATDNT